MSILVLGTVALDTVVTPYGERRDMLGGSAAHFSMAARLFTDVHLVATIGEDFPQKYIDFLLKKGIILSSLKREKGRSFRWQGQYRRDLNTAITLNTELGVLANFNPCVEERQKNIEYIFLANTDPDIQRHLLEQMRCPKLVALDSMNYWIKNKRKSLVRMLKKINIYLANEGEARELSGEYNLVEAVKALQKLGPAMIVLKKGEHGVLCYSDKFIFILPAFAVRRVIDPTGAGDTFAGAFLGYLAKQRSFKDREIKKAIAYGVICASFNVEGFGLERTSALKMAQLNQRLNKFKRHINF